MDGVKLLNTIWQNASSEYQSRIPQATRENLQSVGTAILEYTPMTNIFLESLINRIGRTYVISKMAKNPMEQLKKGKVPLGSDIQEIFINIAKGQPFNPNSTDLLKNAPPDVKACYYRENSKLKYKVTISYEILQSAFVTWASFDSFVAGILRSLTSGAKQDEFLLMKNMVNRAIDNGMVHTLKITNPTTEATGKAFIKAVKDKISEFKYMGTANNKYYDYATAQGGKDITPVSTMTDPEDMVIVLKESVVNSVGVDVLASAFNLDKLALNARLITVDKFDDDGKIAGILCDAGFFQVWDKFETMESFRNPDTLVTHYYLHRSQLFAISPFANAVCFVTDDVAPTKIKAENITVVKDATAQITLSFEPNTEAIDKTVTYLSGDTHVATVSDSGVVTGVSAGTTTITITSGATYTEGYTPASKEITVTVTAE